MSEAEYERFIRRMAAEAGIASTYARRRGMEMTYYVHHRLRGVRLKPKFRP